MRDVRELFSLEGRTAVIIGGAGHVGSAIAGALAEARARIAIVDIDASRANAVASDISSRLALEAISLDVDLEDEAAVRAVPSEVVRRLGRLDVLVNCAALVGTSDVQGWAVPIEKQSTEAWRRALAINLTAPFLLIQAAAGALSRTGSGSVINVASIYGMVGPDERLYEGTTMGNPAAYGASKGGLLQLTRHFATTLAPLVRVNALSLGGIERDQAPQFRERYVSRTPLCRMGKEEDAKGAALFLASDASAYVTGQNVVIDGGFTAW